MHLHTEINSHTQRTEGGYSRRNKGRGQSGANTLAGPPSLAPPSALPSFLSLSPTTPHFPHPPISILCSYELDFFIFQIPHRIDTLQHLSSLTYFTEHSPPRVHHVGIYARIPFFFKSE